MGSGDLNKSEIHSHNKESGPANANMAVEAWDWLKNNVVNPAHNAGWTAPVNAMRNAVNPVSHYVTGSDLISKQQNWEVKTAHSFGLDWLAQNISGGLAGMAPYLIAGKVAGGSMRFSGRMLQVEGTMAKVLASERVALSAGAFAFDYARDPGKGQTRLSNAIGGAAAFAIIGHGNEKSLLAGSHLSRSGLRMAVGGSAAVTQALVSDLAQGRLPDANALGKLPDHFVQGAAMNVLLPWAHEKLTRGTDAVNNALGRGIPVDRFIKQEGLAGQAAGLEHLASENPLARVQLSEANSPKFRRNIAHIDERIVDATARIRSAQEADKAAHGEPSKSIAEVRKEALAREVAAELGDIEAGKAGKAGSVLSNRDIVKALKDGRLTVSLPEAVDGKTVYKPIEVEKLLPQIGTNSLDLTLGDTFVFLPKGRVVDLGKVHPADFLKTLPVETRPEGVLLQPGDFVLAFSREKITLAGESQPGWNGEPPLKGRINIQSGLARMGIPENITAPEINGNSNNPITHEIKNNGDTAVWLRPGMRFGSVVFERLSGPPGLGFQQSRMHGQERPNGAKAEQHQTAGNGDSALAVSPASLTEPASPAADAGMIRGEKPPVTSATAPNEVQPKVAGNGQDNHVAVRTGADKVPTVNAHGQSIEAVTAEQFATRMDNLRGQYQKKLSQPDSAQAYTTMIEAEQRFALDSLSKNPGEWHKYMQLLESDPARRHDYIQAERAERHAIRQMDMNDILRLPDRERVERALYEANDKSRYREYRQALNSRRPDADALARIHDSDASEQLPTREAAGPQRLHPEPKNIVAERPEHSGREMPRLPSPGELGETPRLIESLRVMRDQYRSQGQDSTALQSSIESAQREFALKALTSNPQAWYDYTDALARTPSRSADYANAMQTERSVLQQMDVLSLLKIDSSRVMHALSAMADKTKLSEYMQKSSDTAYTLSSDALKRIHDNYPPANGSGNETNNNGGGYLRRRPRSSNHRQDDLIRDILRKRAKGNLNYGSDGNWISEN